MGVIPLFKSTFSIGRSLLRVEDLVDIAQSGEVKKMILVEDNFYGFRVINKAFLEIEMPMIFGVRLPVVQSNLSEKSSKLIFFPKNNKGVRVVRGLYTKCFTSEGECLNLSDINAGELDEVSIGVPFYDSYIFNNIGETNKTDNVKIIVFAINYNILRIISGMGGLAYSN